MINCKALIKTALREDIGRGDITTRLLIANDLSSSAKFIAKEDGVVCGLEIAGRVFKALDKNIKFSPRVKDGRYVRKGKVLAVVSGKARSILTAERTALNFLSHLSGVATQTRKFVERVKPYNVKIMDTRKTLPGLRQFQKYAVRCGGGYNHRMDLSKQILIKDNHIKCISAGVYKCISLKKLIEIAKKRKPKGVKIEIEVNNLRQFEDALKAKPDIIMLDNMGIKEIRTAVKLLRNSPYACLAGRQAIRNTLLEVSGNVTLNNVRKIARAGINIISIGSITHSAPSLDIALEVK